MLSDPSIRTRYVARLLDLPPLVAQACFDAQFPNEERKPALVVADLGRLVVKPPVCVPGGRGYRPYRVVPALIRTRRRSWPVDLELCPWSDDRTELGLRPTHDISRWFPSDPLLSAGHDLLARLARMMSDWADQPLADLPDRIGATTTRPRADQPQPS